MSSVARKMPHSPQPDLLAEYRCAGCGCPPAPGGAVAVTHQGRTGWACQACYTMAARSPAWRHGCEIAVLTGIPHSEVVKVFAKLGLEPPTSPAEVAAAVEHVIRRSPAP